MLKIFDFLWPKKTDLPQLSQEQLEMLPQHEGYLRHIEIGEKYDIGSVGLGRTDAHVTSIEPDIFSSPREKQIMVPLFLLHHEFGLVAKAGPSDHQLYGYELKQDTRNMVIVSDKRKLFYQAQEDFIYGDGNKLIKAGCYLVKENNRFIPISNFSRFIAPSAYSPLEASSEFQTLSL